MTDSLQVDTRKPAEVDGAIEQIASGKRVLAAGDLWQHANIALLVPNHTKDLLEALLVAQQETNNLLKALIELLSKEEGGTSATETADETQPEERMGTVPKRRGRPTKRP